MIKLLKKLLNMLLALPKKLFAYAKKHPIRMVIAAGALYMCCSGNILAKAQDLVGLNNKILEPQGNDADEPTQNAPEMDDSSMYKDSQLHTMKVADKSAELEDLVNGAHP